jgi:hypothetical protein
MMLAFLRRLVQQRWCAMHGHDDEMRDRDGRLFLRCVSCGWESEGVVLDIPPPVAMRSNVVRFRQRLKAVS